MSWKIIGHLIHIFISLSFNLNTLTYTHSESTHVHFLTRAVEIEKHTQKIKREKEGSHSVLLTLLSYTLPLWYICTYRHSIDTHYSFIAVSLYTTYLPSLTNVVSSQRAEKKHVYFQGERRGRTMHIINCWCISRKQFKLFDKNIEKEYTFREKGHSYSFNSVELQRREIWTHSNQWIFLQKLRDLNLKSEHKKPVLNQFWTSSKSYTFTHCPSQSPVPTPSLRVFLSAAQTPGVTRYTVFLQGLKRTNSLGREYYSPVSLLTT